MNVNFSFFSKILVSSWFGFFCFSADEKYIFFEVEGIKDSKKNYFVISEDWAKSKSFITELKSKGYKLDPNEASYLNLQESEIEKNKISDIKSYSKEEISGFINALNSSMVTTLLKDLPESKKDKKEKERIFEQVCYYFKGAFLSLSITFLHFLEGINVEILDEAIEIMNEAKKSNKQSDEKKAIKKFNSFFGKNLDPLSKIFNKIWVNENKLSLDDDFLKLRYLKRGKGDKNKKNKYIYGGLVALLVTVGVVTFFFLSSKEKDEEKKNLQKEKK